MGELSLTNLTSVGFDTKMDSHVLREVGAVGEGFAAVAALVGFWFSHVDLCVQLKISFGAKSLKIILINMVHYDLEQSMVQVGKTASLVEETDT